MLPVHEAASSLVTGCRTQESQMMQPAARVLTGALTQKSNVVAVKVGDVLFEGELAIAPTPTVRISRAQVPSVGILQLTVVGTAESAVTWVFESVAKAEPQAVSSAEVPVVLTMTLMRGSQEERSGK